MRLFTLFHGNARIKIFKKFASIPAWFDGGGGGGGSRVFPVSCPSCRENLHAPVDQSVAYFGLGEFTRRVRRQRARTACGTRFYESVGRVVMSRCGLCVRWRCVSALVERDPVGSVAHVTPVVRRKRNDARGRDRKRIQERIDVWGFRVKPSIRRSRNNVFFVFCFFQKSFSVRFDFVRKFRTATL